MRIPERPARDRSAVWGGECKEGVTANGGKPLKPGKAVRFSWFSSTSAACASLEVQITLQRIVFNEPACDTETQRMLCGTVGTAAAIYPPWEKTGSRDVMLSRLRMC